MIRLEIGNQYREDDKITSKWIARQFREHKGSEPPCIVAIFEGNDANIAFSAGDCSGGGPGSPKRDYSRRDKALKKAWEEHGVAEDPSIGTLRAFLNEAFRIMDVRASRRAGRSVAIGSR